MESGLFTIKDAELHKIKPTCFGNERDITDLLERILKSETEFISHRIIAYKRGNGPSTGRPDFVLVDSDGRIIIVACKRADNEYTRRKQIAQFIDYAADYSELSINMDWISLTGESVKIDIGKSEPIVCIISDGIHPCPRRVNAFPHGKGLPIMHVSFNQFETAAMRYYTITPQETEPSGMNVAALENLNARIDSFESDRDKVRQIVNAIKDRYPDMVIKTGKKRIALHIVGAEETFGIWLSQKGIRDIGESNISIPKHTLEKCSANSYNRIIEQLKFDFKLKEINNDDVMYYIALDDVLESVVKLIEDIYDNID